MNFYDDGYNKGYKDGERDTTTKLMSQSNIVDSLIRRAYNTAVESGEIVVLRDRFKNKSRTQMNKTINLMYKEIARLRDVLLNEDVRVSDLSPQFINIQEISAEILILSMVICSISMTDLETILKRMDYDDRRALALKSMRDN